MYIAAIMPKTLFLCDLLFLLLSLPKVSCRNWPTEKHWSNPLLKLGWMKKCVQAAGSEERCPVEALTLQEDTVRLDTNSCIGCGLCVTTCPSRL